MDIEEAKKLKSDLEDRVFDLVKYFENETGCVIAMINTRRVEKMGDEPETAWVDITVEF